MERTHPELTRVERADTLDTSKTTTNATNASAAAGRLVTIRTLIRYAIRRGIIGPEPTPGLRAG